MPVNLSRIKVWFDDYIGILRGEVIDLTKKDGFSAGDLLKISEAKALLTDKIHWASEPGGEQAKNAYLALEEFLSSPAAKPNKYCSSCGAKQPT